MLHYNSKVIIRGVEMKKFDQVTTTYTKQFMTKMGLARVCGVKYSSTTLSVYFKLHI